MTFINSLIKAGWNEVITNSKYEKGDWVIYYDTSNWLEISTINNQRVFDVPVPDKSKEDWTLNLIEHLCKTDDELQKLKQKTPENNY